MRDDHLKRGEMIYSLPRFRVVGCQSNAVRLVTPMKMSIKACFAAVLLGLTAGALASPTIELKDGSRIEGDIQSVENGVYTVRTASIGTVHVAQSNIARIVYAAEVPKAAVSSNKMPEHTDQLASDIQQLQASLAKDPAALQAIMSLQSDPQIQAVLNDPAIAKAVEDGDYASLMNNPKIRALENNEHVKQLVQQQTH